jgi:hypothetical protein
MVELVRATVNRTRKIRIHNMLSQAAWYFKTVIEEKQKNGDEVGITYTCMGCATMLAFTWEAYLNYFGDELIGDYWKEDQPLDQKIDLVFQKLKITPDWSKRPYQSISTLTRLRNTLAHGKPFSKTEITEVINKAEKITNKKIDLSGDWEGKCKPDFVLKAHDDLDDIFKQMLGESGISILDTLTIVDGSISFVEKIDPQKK